MQLWKKGLSVILCLVLVMITAVLLPSYQQEERSADWLVAAAEINEVPAGESIAISFGSNFYGELGLGDTTSRNVPVIIPGLTNVKAVSTEFEHSLLLLENGDVYSFGKGEYGGLGLGDEENRLTPTKIAGLTNVKAVSAGFAYSLALLENGDVYSFGRNLSGQLGLGDTDTRLSPVKIAGLSNVKAVEAGNYHSLVLLENGDVYTFGNNTKSQLGLGGTSNRLVPTKIPDLSSIKAISVGFHHSLALTEAGEVYSWGINDYGQLGLGDNDWRGTPVKIPGLTNVKAISTEGNCSLVLLENGDVYSFGFGYYGQLGLGEYNDTRTVPTKIPGLSNIQAVATGGNHSLALTTGGEVYSFGSSTQGQLGLGDNQRRLTPTPIPGLNNVKAIDIGFTHSIVIQSTAPAVWSPGYVFEISPVNPIAGREITFDASSFVLSGRSIRSYTWYFGDGSVGAGKIVTNTYSEPGNYTARLIVTDQAGAAYSTNAPLSVYEHPLSSEINTMYDHTYTEFINLKSDTGTICNVGDYFTVKMDEQLRKTAVDFVLDAIGSIMSVYDLSASESLDKLAFAGSGETGITHLIALMPASMQYVVFSVESAIGVGLKQIAYDISDEVIEEGVELVTMDFVKGAFASRFRQMMFGDYIYPGYEDSIEAYETKLAEIRDQLLNFQQSLSPAEIELYRQDLNKRARANDLLASDYNRNVAVLDLARDKRQAAGIGAIEKFILKYGTKLIFGILADGPGVFVHSMANLAWSTYQNVHTLTEDQRVYAMALGATSKGYDISRRIFLNSARGLDNIRTGTTPVIPEAQITDGAHILQTEQKLTSICGYLRTVKVVTQAYTELYIRNSGTSETVYEVTAEWAKEGKLFGGGDTVNVFTDQASISIPPGETKCLKINYLEGEHGEYPIDETDITFNILGTTDSGTYLINEFDLPFYGMPPGVGVDSHNKSFNILSDPSETETFAYPVFSRLEYAENNEYVLKVLAENPFEEAVAVLFSQDIPAGVTINNPGGGNLNENILAWEATLEPGEMAQFTANFAYQGEYGAQVEFPAGTLLMQDMAAEGSTEFPTEPLSVTHRIPIEGSGSTPSFISAGEELIVPVSLTNLLNESILEGSLVIELEEEAGAKTTLYSQNLTLQPGENRSVNTTFTPDANSGSYRLNGRWQSGSARIGLFSERVLIDAGHLIGKITLQGQQNHSGVEVDLGQYSASTNADGSFAFQAAGAGDYLLSIDHPGYQAYSQAVSIGPQITCIPDITLDLEYQPPIASFNYASSDLYDPLSKSFSALASSSPDDEIVSYAWDFGDGSTAEGQEATHTFAGPGSYEISLTVADSRGVEGSVVREVEVKSGSKLIGLDEIQAVLFEDNTVNLAEQGQDVPRQVLLKDQEGDPLARFMVRFDLAEGDIDLSALVAAIDTEGHKSIIYMDNWPQEIDDTKYLYIPSSGKGRVYICPEAVALEEVNYEEPEKVIIEAGNTDQGMTVLTAVYHNKSYYVVQNIRGGGGEFNPDTIGDINRDGSIDSGDAVLILRHVVGLLDIAETYGAEGLALADVNASGTVDVGDAVLVFRYVNNLIDQFP